MWGGLEHGIKRAHIGGDMGAAHVTKQMLNLVEAIAAGTVCDQRVERDHIAVDPWAQWNWRVWAVAAVWVWCRPEPSSQWGQGRP